MARHIHSRNAGKAGLVGSAQAATLPGRTPQAPPGEGGLLLAPGSSPRDAWVAWLAPVFAGNDSMYFTGTYSDDYGFANGLTLSRNVHKDWRRWLKELGLDSRYIVAVEQHRFRDVLHLHAIIEGPFSEGQRDWLKRWWSADRGHARALPVQDGCASYVTKYALKGDTDSFEWRLS